MTLWPFYFVFAVFGSILHASVLQALSLHRQDFFGNHAFSHTTCTPLLDFSSKSCWHALFGWTDTLDPQELRSPSIDSNCDQLCSSSIAHLNPWHPWFLALTCLIYCLSRIWDDFALSGEQTILIWIRPRRRKYCGKDRRQYLYRSKHAKALTWCKCIWTWPMLYMWFSINQTFP